MTVTFDQARQIVADSSEVRACFPPDDFMVGDYGWENATEFRVVAGTRMDVTRRGDLMSMTVDPPLVLVDKASGAVRLKYVSRITGDVLAGMTPIGAVPG